MNFLQEISLEIFLFRNARASLARAAFRRDFLYNHGGRRSIAGIKESFKGNAARARLARGFRNKKISREISCKKFKTHLQFYVKISNKNFSSFFTGKSLYNFSKKLLLRPFFKNSLQEGVFENSLKFLQLLQNLTPIRKLFCTFLY